MKIRLILFVVLMTCMATASTADTMANCRTNNSEEEQIGTCTRILEGSKTKKNKKAEAFRIRGELRMNAGANIDALEDFSSAIALDPANHEALAGRGTVRLSLGKADAAVADFNSAVQLNQKSIQYLMFRGHANLVTGEIDSAIQDFDLVIKRQPSDAIALNNRGLAFRMKEDFDRAIDNYSAAINASPLYGLAYSNRGHVYKILGKKEKAITDFRRALFIDPSLSGAQQGLQSLGAAKDISAHSQRLVREGKRIAEKNCAWCHAISEQGMSSNLSAPPFRTLQDRHPLLALRKPLERGIAATHENMPKFDLTDSEVDQLVAYINSLD